MIAKGATAVAPLAALEGQELRKVKFPSELQHPWFLPALLLYHHLAPNKVGKVPELLVKYRGNERDWLSALLGKYVLYDVEGQLRRRLNELSAFQNSRARQAHVDISEVKAVQPRKYTRRLPVSVPSHSYTTCQCHEAELARDFPVRRDCSWRQSNTNPQQVV